MKLPWQKESAPPVQTAKGRAAVVPRSYKFQIARNVTSNNFTVNSYSTIITTVRVLKDGETAANTAEWLPGTINFGAEKYSVEEIEAQGLQRVQFDAPNWVGVIVSTDSGAYIDHVELPVWIDTATGRIESVDVPALIEQLEPKREKLSAYWGETEGPFAEIHQLITAPREIIKAGKFFASLPGEWIGAVKDLVKDLKTDHDPYEPLPPEQVPDMTQYPPVDGVTFHAWAAICQNLKNLEKVGIDYETYKNAGQVWTERVRADEKLALYFQNEIHRLRKGGEIRGCG